MEKPKTNKDEIRSNGLYISDQLGQDPYVPDTNANDPDDVIDVMFHNDEPGGGIYDQEDLRNPNIATGRLDSRPDFLEGSEEHGITVVDSSSLHLGSKAAALVGLNPRDAAAEWLKANDPDYVSPPADESQEAE